jgi:hypothetical protein
MGNSGEFARDLRVAMLEAGARVVLVWLRELDRRSRCMEEGTSGVTRSWMRVEFYERQ